MEISKNVKKFLKHDYIQELLNNYNFDDLYVQASNYNLYPSEIGNLTEIMLSSGVNPLINMKVIPQYFLTSVSTIDKIEIPKNVEIISQYAFYYCLKLKEVEMAEGVKNICYQAFGGCESLEKITLPSTLKHIGYDIFDSCYKLKEINFRGTIQQWETAGISESLANSFVKVIHCKDGDIEVVNQ